ncbi:hypothetical protein BH10PSE11_BH10PSE11_15860 [soil metagenome]
MILRFIAFALTLLVFTPGSVLSVVADDVGLSAAERAKNIKAYEARKAQGQATDAPRGARMGQQPHQAQQVQPQRAQQRAQQQQQQAMQQAKRCQDAVNDAQNAAMGASVASSVVGFIPFGGVASSVVGAAAGVGSMAAGEVARQKMAAGC